MYRPEIDGLRALAVLPVLLFHAGFQFFQGGFVGVDIFFVISGYLIANIIINELSIEEREQLGVEIKQTYDSFSPMLDMEETLITNNTYIIS